MSQHETLTTAPELVKKYVPESVRTMFSCIAPTGSVWICGREPDATDIDFVCYAPKMLRIVHKLGQHGWDRDGSEVKNEIEADERASKFASFSRPDDEDVFVTVNLIVTSDNEFFNRFLLATHVCRTLNVQVKAERVKIFQAILYKNYPDDTYYPHDEMF